MSQNLDLGEFKETAIIKKLKKSKSNDNLKNIDTAKTETKEKRGRKQQYPTIEERKEARKLQQKAYRERKEAELQSMRDKIIEYENKKVSCEEKGITSGKRYHIRKKVSHQEKGITSEKTSR